MQAHTLQILTKEKTHNVSPSYASFASNQPVSGSSEDILDMCGDIKGAHLAASASTSATVDLSLAQSIAAEQLFRLRVDGIKLNTMPKSKITGMGGFGCIGGSEASLLVRQ